MDHIKGSLLVGLGIISVALAIAGSYSHFTRPNDREGEVRHSSYLNDASAYGIKDVTAASTHSERIYGGIVSHHLLANLDIEKFFLELGGQDVERVVLIGPNHFSLQSDPGISTLYDYDTPFGVVQTDTEYVRTLRNEGLVSIDPEVIGVEHAISSLVPYIAYHMPDAKVVPIIINRSSPKEYAEKLADFLYEHTSGTTLVIASVDFSHHLQGNAADLHDLRTVAALTNFDSAHLYDMEVDSPQSLYALTRYMERSGAQKVSLRRQNAANIFNDRDMEDVTSYVFAHYMTGVYRPTSAASILFFGDVMLGRGMSELLERGTTDLFEGIRGTEGNFFRGYDAIAVNLEGAVLSPTCDTNDDELAFDEKYLSMLRREGITYVGTANNHFMRCKAAYALLAKYGLSSLGEERTVSINGTNMTINVVSLYAAPIPDDVTALVKRVRAEASSDKNTRLVVNIHWGVEYETVPSAKQRELAHALIDAGADLIIGHHPHVVEPVEVYRGGVIVYSLGNFISDQSGTLNRTGLGAGVFFDDERTRLYLFPFEQKNGIPHITSQSEARSYCARIAEGSASYISELHPCVLEVGVGK